MLNRQLRVHRATVAAVLVAGIFGMATSTALAQDRERPSLIGSIARQVALDPSTYAPAIIAFDGTMRDWKTSQPLFENGFMEHNSRFTISGRANDLPVPYADGRRRILIDAATTFGVSALNNFTTRVIERKLTERYPEHRTLVRAASWVERISFGVYLSYVLSKDHYRQAGLNTAQAQQLGYR